MDKLKSMSQMKTHLWLTELDLQAVITTFPSDTVKHVPEDRFFSPFVCKQQRQHKLPSGLHSD